MDIIKIFRVDYEKWSYESIDKIIKCIDTSETEEHLKACKKMIDQFVVVSIFNSNFNSTELQRITILLNAYLNTKKV